MSNLYDMSGTQLKKLAKARGMSGAELAKRRDIRPETVSRHMNDRTAMSQADLQAYAEILEVEVSNLIAQSAPTPVFGVLDRSSVVHPRHASQPPQGVTFGGPSAVGSVSTAVLQPKQMVRTATHDFTRLGFDDVQLDGCFFVHAASLVSQEISRFCHAQLCMSSAETSNGEYSWILGALYPQPENTFARHDKIDDYRATRRYTIVPYWASSDIGLIEDVKVEAAAPVLSKIYAPEVIGIELHDLTDQTDG